MKIRLLGKLLKRVHGRRYFVLSNAPASIGWGQLMSLHKTGSQIIPADATSVADLEILVDKAVEALGGKIDFVLHSIGMSVNVRKGNHYTSQNYDYTEKAGMYLRFLSQGDAGIV
jgi:enoyl-[acyl-carrier protein] reductase I